MEARARSGEILRLPEMKFSYKDQRVVILHIVQEANFLPRTSPTRKCTDRV